MANRLERDKMDVLLAHFSTSVIDSQSLLWDIIRAADNELKSLYALNEENVESVSSTQYRVIYLNRVIETLGKQVRELNSVLFTVKDTIPSGADYVDRETYFLDQRYPNIRK